MPTSLQSLSQAQLAKSFELVPFPPEERLRPDTANALFQELPVSCAESVASLIDSELYYKRACSQVSVLGCRKEEHVSFKRMFFELRVQDLLQTTINLPRSIAENIYQLKLSVYPRDFPLDEVCSQLPNLNRLDIKYNMATSSHDSLGERVPRALNVSNNLISLTLQESFLTDNDIRTMFGTAGSCTNNTILNLNLAHNNITSTGLADIVNHFIAPPTSVLCSLDMMGNRIDSEGGSVLGQALATNCSLLDLSLRLNNLGDGGGSALLECLKKNMTLRYMNLSANNLASCTAKTLVTLLESNNALALETVIITSNSFSDEDEEAISSCKQCFLDVRGGSSPARQEMFLGKSLMPF